MLLASSYDQSRYFKAEDFEGEKKLRIKEGTEELIGETKDRKLVIWFTNDEHGLPLNRTNNRTLRGAFGDEVDGWKGKIITLYRTEAEFKGRLVAALRIRIPAPKTDAGNGQKTPAKPTSTKEILGHFASPPAAPKPLPPVEEDLDDEIPFE